MLESTETATDKDVEEMDVLLDSKKHQARMDAAVEADVDFDVEW
jgi:hypothetical protein